MFRHSFLIALAAVAAAIVLVAADAHARAGGGFSGGSRGMRTFSMPPTTRTAPTAAPIQRTMAQPGSASVAGQTATRPGFFGGGLFGGLAAGFLGAGLFGLLFGHGFFGSMAGFASLIGLLLQVMLVVIVARMIFAWWQRRQMLAYAAAQPAAGHGFAGLGGILGASAPAGEALAIDKADYDAFGTLLGAIQADFSDDDLTALRAKVTPEMLSYFSEQLAQNASRGLINRVTGVKLLQGDLAEAWREGEAEYATVAMRFGLTDSMVERTSGHHRRRQPERGHRVMDLPARAAATGCSRRFSRRDRRIACVHGAGHAPADQADLAGAASARLTANLTPTWLGLRQITRQ